MSIQRVYRSVGYQVDSDRSYWRWLPSLAATPTCCTVTQVTWSSWHGCDSCVARLPLLRRRSRASRGVSRGLDVSACARQPSCVVPYTAYERYRWPPPDRAITQHGRHQHMFVALFRRRRRTKPIPANAASSQWQSLAGLNYDRLRYMSRNNCTTHMVC